MLLDKLVISMVYLPPDAHEYSTLFETRLTLPVAAKLDLSVGVVEGFLPYTEHPPGAQRSCQPAVRSPRTEKNSGPNASVGNILA